MDSVCINWRESGTKCTRKSTFASWIRKKSEYWNFHGNADIDQPITKVYLSKYTHKCTSKHTSKYIYLSIMMRRMQTPQ